MKKITVFLLLLMLLLPAATSQAQAQVTTLDSLAIDFWPDYDQPSVLVLMTGVFPAGTALPATITVPMPENAQLNAAAYLSNADGMMNAEFTSDANTLTLTTPELNFRVEYYMPYTSQDTQRSFTFTWISDLSVNQLEAKVQQPIAAGSLVVEPPATNVSEGNDGLTYHALASQAVPAGQSLAINVNYTMSSPQLTIETANVEAANDVTIDLQPMGPVSSAVPETTKTTNWPVIAGVAGGILVVAAVAVLYFGNRPKTRVRKPRPTRTTKDAAQFCHNCGESMAVRDKFCRQCGTAVKKV